MFRLTTPFVLATLSISALAHKAYNPLMGRTEHPPQIPLACSLPQDAKCKCPTDLTGDVHGVMINVYPGYQCAYSGGACTWNDKTGELQNTGQTNCPNPGPSCGRFGCHCPLDNNKDFGVMINQFTGYQCAYGNGACTWDFDGVLQNIYQTNCPQRAPCVPA